MVIRWQRYKDSKIWACGKDSIPFDIFEITMRYCRVFSFWILNVYDIRLSDKKCRLYFRKWKHISISQIINVKLKYRNQHVIYIIYHVTLNYKHVRKWKKNIYHAVWKVNKQWFVGSFYFFEWQQKLSLLSLLLVTCTIIDLLIWLNCLLQEC